MKNRSWHELKWVNKYKIKDEILSFGHNKYIFTSNFQQQSLRSHDPTEIILICWLCPQETFIVIIINYYYYKTA